MVTDGNYAYISARKRTLATRAHKRSAGSQAALKSERASIAQRAVARLRLFPPTEE